MIHAHLDDMLRGCAVVSCPRERFHGRPVSTLSETATMLRNSRIVTSAEVQVTHVVIAHSNAFFHDVAQVLLEV